MPVCLPRVGYQHPRSINHTLLLEQLQQLLPHLSSQLWRSCQQLCCQWLRLDIYDVCGEALQQHDSSTALTDRKGMCSAYSACSCWSGGVQQTNP